MLLHALLTSVIVLFQLLSPTTADDHAQSPIHESPLPNQRLTRIAIIGAGPGGSSASYYLRKFSQQSATNAAEEHPVDITVFESNPYIGGRSTTINALNDSRYPVELGASIFVEINHILYNATREFGLQASGKLYRGAGDAKFELGIWDGERFVFKAKRDDDNDGGGKKSSWWGWWDIAKLLWKYGLAPIRTRTATRKAVGEFLRFYDGPIFPFASLQEAVDLTGLAEYTGFSGAEVMRREKVGELFAREIIQASTTVNYASNLGTIHGLETLVCMAIEGAMAVEGGNWQIFDQMVYSSADEVVLNTAVMDVVRSESGRYTVRTQKGEFQQKDDGMRSIEEEVEYDAVILAAPYQFSNLKFSPPLRNPPKEIPYVELYVTLFTSPHRLSPKFFGLESQADVPSSVLTTLTPEMSEQLSKKRGVDAVGPSGFFSISTLRVLHPSTDRVFSSPTQICEEQDDEGTQYLYKIFSPAGLTEHFLASLLGIDLPPGPPPPPASTTTEENSPTFSLLSQRDVTWMVKKHWYSYPYELPRTEFENFTLCVSEECEAGGVKEGLWYLNGMESFISTMETSALSGMNVARLVVDGLKGKVG